MLTLLRDVSMAPVPSAAAPSLQAEPHAARRQLPPTMTHTSGNILTRIPMDVTLTAAPARTSDAAVAITCSRMFATSDALSPSIRIRITDGVVDFDIASSA